MHLNRVCCRGDSTAHPSTQEDCRTFCRISTLPPRISRSAISHLMNNLIAVLLFRQGSYAHEPWLSKLKARCSELGSSHWPCGSPMEYPSNNGNPPQPRISPVWPIILPMRLHASPSERLATPPCGRSDSSSPVSESVSQDYPTSGDPAAGRSFPFPEKPAALWIERSKASRWSRRDWTRS